MAFPSPGAQASSRASSQVPERAAAAPDPTTEVALQILAQRATTFGNHLASSVSLDPRVVSTIPVDFYLYAALPHLSLLAQKQTNPPTIEQLQAAYAFRQIAQQEAVIIDSRVYDLFFNKRDSTSSLSELRYISANFDLSPPSQARTKRILASLIAASIVSQDLRKSLEEQALPYGRIGKEALNGSLTPQEMQRALQHPFWLRNQDIVEKLRIAFPKAFSEPFGSSFFALPDPAILPPRVQAQIQGLPAPVPPLPNPSQQLAAPLFLQEIPERLLSKSDDSIPFASKFDAIMFDIFMGARAAHRRAPLARRHTPSDLFTYVAFDDKTPEGRARALFALASLLTWAEIKKTVGDLNKMRILGHEYLKRRKEILKILVNIQNGEACPEFKLRERYETILRYRNFQPLEKQQNSPIPTFTTFVNTLSSFPIENRQSFHHELSLLEAFSEISHFAYELHKRKKRGKVRWAIENFQRLLSHPSRPIIAATLSALHAISREGSLRIETYLQNQERAFEKIREGQSAEIFEEIRSSQGFGADLLKCLEAALQNEPSPSAEPSPASEEETPSKRPRRRSLSQDPLPPLTNPFEEETLEEALLHPEFLLFPPSPSPFTLSFSDEDFLT